MWSLPIINMNKETKCIWSLPLVNVNVETRLMWSLAFLEGKRKIVSATALDREIFDEMNPVFYM